METIVAGIVLGIAGLIIGILLGFALMVFGNESNETVDRIERSLPGYNCGACGYAGCHELACAIARGEESPERCKIYASQKNKKNLRI